ncbi:hypothetical protein JHK84_044124 [Glycine max]|uniref:RING-H2 finger protein ATL52 n=1 Tax=Glycine soja TaxID=3848 RepID=A0A445GCP9_GLYSO|nr:hypothetical protein JHK86_044018 [Glycine max]KAG5107217.1 hypothetical protein JHK84_044124 [Glycine max]RZB58938.1 RING-H2 finger protein ATL52 [Glycine soja]
MVVVVLIVIANHIMTRLHQCNNKIPISPFLLILLKSPSHKRGNGTLPWASHSWNTGLSFDDKFSPCRSLESHSITFHYKAAEGTNQTECVICLTSFEEEDSVWKLHTCRHIFHTSCIYKWLASHFGCPLCRTQIDKVNSPNSRVALESNDHGHC